MIIDVDKLYTKFNIEPKMPWFNVEEVKANFLMLGANFPNKANNKRNIFLTKGPTHIDNFKIKTNVVCFQKIYHVGRQKSFKNDFLTPP